MNRSGREGGWRSGEGARKVSSNVRAGDNSLIQAPVAGRDMGDVTQSVEWQKDDPRVAEVRARLEEFRTALSRLGADEERQIGLRAADRLERALDTPSNQRDAIEGAADTIGLVGRTITAVAAAATAVHQAASGLF